MKLKDVPAPVWWTASVFAVAALVYKFVLKPAGAAALAAVDPTSDKNAAYSGVNKVGAALSGNKDFSLGSAVFNLFHRDEGKDITTPTPVGADDGADSSGTRTSSGDRSPASYTVRRTPVGSPANHNTFDPESRPGR